MADLIIDINKEKHKDELYKLAAVKALKTMSEILVEMEASAMEAKDMMKLCVWPILEEARGMFEKINKGEDVDLDGFEKLFDKPKK